MHTFTQRLLIGVVAMTTTTIMADIPRTADGKPDLSGFFDVATITPMERPEKLGEKMSISPEEARKMERERAERQVAAAQKSDPDRKAPPVGGSVGG